MRRRVYLASLGASMTAIAGCNNQSSSDTQTSSPTQTSSASETPTPTDTPDRPLRVRTERPADVTYDSATLRGTLFGAYGDTDVRVLFQWRPADGEWNSIETAAEPEFSAEIDGLRSDTVYECRAVAIGDERVQGEIWEFTTEENVLTYDGGGTPAFREVLVEASERPGARIQFEKGTYEFDPLEPYDIENPPGPHVSAADLTDITIAGNGSTIRFTEARMGGFHLFDSKSITVRNLTFDYASLPFTQGTITDVSSGGREFVLEIDEGYASLSAERFGQGEVFASIHQSDGSFISGIKANGLPIKRFRSLEQLGAGRWRLTLSETSTTRGIATGRRLAITARDPPGSARALQFRNIDEPQVENVTVNASPSFAVLFANCRSPHIENVRVAPPEDSDRLIGSDADGIHVLNNRGGPTITDCYVERLLDDGIIVSSLMARVEAVDDSTVTLQPTGVFSPRPEDTIEVMTPTGVRGPGLPNVDSVVPEQAADGVAPVRRIEFESSVAGTIEAGDYLANSTTANRGFEVRNNTVRDNRANAIRISGGPGEIVGNEFYGTQNQTINILCDTSGTYAPERWTNDLVIADNSVRDSGKSYLGGGQPAGVFLVHSPAEGLRPEGRPHRNIEVVNNSFENLGFRAGILANVQNVTVAQNTVDGVNELDYSNGRDAFLVRNARDAVFERNTVAGASAYLDHFGRRRDVDGLETSDNTFRLDGASQSPTFQ